MAPERTLVLSLDYELFFGRSGSIERCLVEPCEALDAVARQLGLKLSFFVDAGMILCMQRHAPSRPAVARMASQVRRHVAVLAAAGHEIALHVHPHWEDTAWGDDGWDFSRTRYGLRDFSAMEISSIFAAYTACLAELAGQRPAAYRAGGFCVTPFGPLATALVEAGINIDSSVVPGAALQDADKGFDFRDAPGAEWWRFEDSPTQPRADGSFLELPVTPQWLPLHYYWGRLAQRGRGPDATPTFGDGMSKGIGVREIARRLAGLSRIAEMSIDHPKFHSLLALEPGTSGRRLWHVMGHPKLLSRHSLEALGIFVERMRFTAHETVASAAARIRAGGISPDGSRA